MIFEDAIRTHYILLQLIIVDLISLIEVKWELFYINHRSWLGSIEWSCPVYLGIDALTNTAQIFFIIALNFHSISTYNLGCKTVQRNKEKLLYYEAEALENNIRDLCDVFDESDRTCSHNSASEIENRAKFHRGSHQRSIYIDYSKPKSRISVLLPIIFIWLLALSMSVPLFLFGRIIPTLNSSERICGLVVMNNTFLLQILLIKMRIVVPTLCLVLSTMHVILKLWMAKEKASKFLVINNSIDILKLALSLALIYILFSMQRIYGSLLFELISRPMMEFKYGKFNKLIGITGSIIHYTSIFIRPLMYVRFEKTLQINLWKGCLMKG
ncbi:uncharacterized protein LOC129568673 isoform X2 [Sitodiplosis mosellana]|uniref:uncharacterized protein LOC129568673 isoform X2 n=1 Tax=Sitodiplosis mosellana TaxID=263140 RepID=UPI002443FF44|nr:uncharacterized protein LOC129568673 isoform X2 [Sitodiplosis mosellana]